MIKNYKTHKKIKIKLKNYKPVEQSLTWKCEIVKNTTKVTWLN